MVWIARKFLKCSKVYLPNMRREKKLDQKKESDRSKSFGGFNYFRRSEKMSMKSVWLLGFLVLALAFAGFAGTAEAGTALVDEIKIEAHDAEDRPDNQYGIRLVRITVEGEIDTSNDLILGTIELNGVQVIQGQLRNGGHELLASEGADIVTKGGVKHMVECNRDGEFLFSFFLPAEVVGTSDSTVTMTFGNEENDLAPAIYDPTILAQPAGERDNQFAIQVVKDENVTDWDLDDRVYTNGDNIQLELEYESLAVADGGQPLSENKEIDLLTILPDFSNVDRAFALGNSNINVPPFGLDNDTTSNSVTRQYGRYDLGEWNPGNKNFNSLDLYDLVLDVDRAKRDGRLVIDADGGDIRMTYIISQYNTNGPGYKRVFVHAVDFPSVLDIENDAETIFDRAGLDFPDDLNLGMWQTGDPFVDDDDDDNNDVNLDNKAPNFDFAFINPFVDPPLRKWVDFDQDGRQDADEWAYVYKEGDVIRVMVQIDPHDLTEQELNEVKEDDLHDTGNEDGTVRNIQIIGDISDLLNPEHPDVDMTNDGNGNGIPDDAEVRFVQYAGGNGRDDDFDGEDGEYDDDEDTTVNGVNERFLYLLEIEVDERFKGVSGDRPYTAEGLAIRFMIQDSVGNRAYLSAWRETLFDPEIWRWIPVDYTEWNGNVRDIGLVDDTRNPMYFDPPTGDEVFVPSGEITIGGITYYSSLSYEPTPQRAGIPSALSGFNIVANWEQPWRVVIDAAPPNASMIANLTQRVGTADEVVLKGGAVVPVRGLNNVNHIPQTDLVGGRDGFVTDGNFAYEVTGRNDELITLEATFPSDDDMYFVKFQYSDDGTDFMDMKGSFNDYEKARQFVGAALPRESLLLYDIAGNITDVDAPGFKYGVWHDGINGDDDEDNQADWFDQEVNRARSDPQNDNIDNDADGLVDDEDRDENNVSTEVYDLNRDDDEDGIMDEDEYVIPTWYDPVRRVWVARWTFDPVRVARLLELTTGKIYAVRAKGYDLAGNVVEASAAPIYLVFNLEGPGVPGPSGEAEATLYRGSDDDAANIVDDDGVIPEGREFIIRTEVTSTAIDQITLRYSMDKKSWVSMDASPNPDDTLPFRARWTPSLQELAQDLSVGGVPFRSGDRLFIKAFAGRIGALGKYAIPDGEFPPNLQGYTFIPYDPIFEPPISDAEGEEFDVSVFVSDGTDPMMVMIQVDSDEDMSDGALAPVASNVILKARSQKLLFSLTEFTQSEIDDIVDDLNDHTVSADLRDEFEDAGYDLWDAPPDPIVQVRTEWQLFGVSTGEEVEINGVPTPKIDILEDYLDAGNLAELTLLELADIANPAIPDDSPLKVKPLVRRDFRNEFASFGYPLPASPFIEQKPGDEWALEDDAGRPFNIDLEGTGLNVYTRNIDNDEWWIIKSGEAPFSVKLENSTFKIYTWEADISDAEFQYAQVYPDGSIANWQTIPDTPDLTILPDSSVVAVSLWDTRNVLPGRYDVRCVCWDNSGNSNPELAPIIHVVVGAGKYAAFMTTLDVSGAMDIIEARTYNRDNDINSIARVIFQYEDANGAWVLIDSVNRATDQYTGNMNFWDESRGYVAFPNHTQWHAEWTIQDLAGIFRVRALVEDNRGYVNEGIPVEIEVKGASLARTYISNFSSNANENPRVSMNIARNTSIPDIKIEATDEIFADKMRIILKAAEIPGGGTPDDVIFEYLINKLDSPVNPKSAPDSAWTHIFTDDEPSNGVWQVDDGWDIPWNHELHNLKVATLVYVRAVAIKGGVRDKYMDEDDFVPYVGLVFEETTEPTCNIARIERDGTSVGDDLENEKRVTGGVLNVIPFVVDQEVNGPSDHRASGVVEVELFYKLCKETDIGKWISADIDTSPPFSITWDVSDGIDMATGKYELMMVATDQVGNRSANVRDLVSSLRSRADLIRLLTIDNTGPDAFVEDPYFAQDGEAGGRLSADKDVWVSASSYEGCLDILTLWYNTGLPGYEIEEGAEDVPIRRIYQDLNRNGVWDPGEPFRWELPPEEGDWLPDVPGVTGGWEEIGRLEPFEDPWHQVAPAKVMVDDVYEFTYNSAEDYYFYDENGNGLYDAGEPAWKDKLTGNTGRFNNNKRMAEETLIIGAPVPGDEVRGTKFTDIPGRLKDLGIICSADGVNVRWADLDATAAGEAAGLDPTDFKLGEFDQTDFIWVDLDGDLAYDCVEGGVGEPIVYASGMIDWTEIMDLPPTNATEFELRVQACDKKDSAGKDGNCGPEALGNVTVGNILLEVRKVNGRNLWEGQYVNEYLRVTGDTVEVVVRVWPQPISGADVQLWFRYDDDINPGAPDGTYNGYPDNGTRANSRWDSLDNDADNTPDEEQTDVDGNDKKWGEVNVWQQAAVSGGSSVTDSNADENWFEVTLTWNVTGLEDEHQYEFIPIVVDASTFGVDFEYSPLPWMNSATAFPQFPCSVNDGEDNDGDGLTDNLDPDEDDVFLEIIVDHQAPYTYTQVVLDTDDYEDTEEGLDSWHPLNDLPGTPIQTGTDKIIIRNNNGIVDKRAGDGDCEDDSGETAYKIYDIQAKVVSIYGGIYFTKLFDEGAGGVGKSYNPDAGGAMFQYSTDDGATWTDLGYDPDPDYFSTYVKSGDVMVAEGMMRHDARDVVAFGQMIPYTGQWAKVEDDHAVTVFPDIHTAATQKIVVSTFSLNDVDISTLPPTNGTEYMFRVVMTKDMPDVYSSRYGEDRQNTTGEVPTSGRDEIVVENRVGDGHSYATDDQNFMRDINWKTGVPFSPSVSPPVDIAVDIFRNLHVDIANLEYISGPRSVEGKDQNYTVNNIVPEAKVMRVYDEVFWSATDGFDEIALAGDADGVHAVVPKGEHVLIEAVVNPTPADSTAWGTTPEAAVDINRVRFYVKPRQDGEWNGKEFNEYTGYPETGIVAQADLPNTGDNYPQRFTVRIDTEKLLEDYPNKGAEFQLLALAADKDGNVEPFLCKATGEVIIRVEDMMGPDMAVGGLALDIDHLKEVLVREGAGLGGVAFQLIEPYLNFTFTDEEGLDLNNMGNALFPSSPSILDNDTNRLPVGKVSGEWLHLYIRNTGGGDVRNDGVTVSVYDKNNSVVAQPTVAYSKDTTDADGNLVRGMVPHTFTLSEQTALLYLPTWTETEQNLPRFEHVWMYYRKDNNSTDETGSKIAPPDDPAAFGGEVVSMTQYHNISKGESIWKVNLDLELGQTYFYFFVVDTVGDTWVIPDPKNLTFDEFVNDNTYPDFLTWMYGPDGVPGGGDDGPGGYLIEGNIFLNLPLVSKIWIPGTPTLPANDELWATAIDLDALPDGVYEVRIETEDKAGFTELLSKTIVVDRTAPEINPEDDLKVPDRVKANSEVPLQAIIHDSPGINAVETVGVLFEMSRKGNTPDAESVWQYAIGPGTYPPVQIPIPAEWQLLEQPLGLPHWLGKIALDPFPADGWMAPWKTPETDQEVPVYIRAVPFDDALNVQVSQANQKLVVIDGAVPKAKVVRASAVRAGGVAEDGADGYTIYPDDKDVTLYAQLVKNAVGTKGVTFEYSLKDPGSSQGVTWATIPASQYSDAARVPNDQGEYVVTWQVDFSQLASQDTDQYFHVRAKAEDDVGNVDDVDPILTIMVLNDITGPQAFIKEVNCENVLSPHLAVTKRNIDLCGEGDPGSVDVAIEAHNVAAVMLEYRTAGGDWVEVKTVTGAISGITIIPWDVAVLGEGRYELRATAYDGDGNSITDPDVVVVVVDHTEPKVTQITIKSDFDRDVDHIYEGTITDIWRYMEEGGDYFNVTVSVKADATDPTEKVEAREIVLQYLGPDGMTWVTIGIPAASDGIDNDGDGDVDETGEIDAKFIYSKVSDTWTKTFAGTNALGRLIPRLLSEIDGEIKLRAWVTDYAYNHNTLDRDSIVTLIADAHAPEIIAVYSGGRAWEGGSDPTIVAYAGDPVDLWVKLRDPGAGVKSVEFYIPGSNPKTITTQIPTPYTVGLDKIGNGDFFDTNGDEEIWHMEWNTLLNQNGSNFQYIITAKATDNASNSKHPTGAEDPRARVKVEKDVTAPVPPEVLFVVTHAGQITGRDGGLGSANEDNVVPGDLPLILDEWNAPDYTIRKMLPIKADTNLDSDRADKYQVFDLYNNTQKYYGDPKSYIEPDQYDTSVEIWVRTPEIEYGVDPGTKLLRQYEDPEIAVAKGGKGLGNAKGPEYLKVNYGSLGHDPGIDRVWVEIGYAGQGTDPADVATWVKMDNTHLDKLDPEFEKDVDDHYLTRGNVGTGNDVRKVILRLDDPDYVDRSVEGHAYYWVMGDDGVEDLWNSEASVENKREALRPTLGKDGNYFIRAKARDNSDNHGEWGYTLIRVHNQDDIPPGNTFIYALNGDDASVKWNVLEWKWHQVTVRTRRNQVGPWLFGGMGLGDGPGPDKDFVDINDSKNNGDRDDAFIYNKFFGDIDYVIVEAWDPICGKWVNVTKDSKLLVPSQNVDYNHETKMNFYTRWEVSIDSSLVGDGDSKLRAYAVDNGGRFNAPYPDGSSDVHKQKEDTAKRNFEPGDSVPTRDILVDNPRAQVLMPVSGALLQRGSTVTVQAIPVSPNVTNPDPARNGHDVGQVAFLVRRKAAPNGGVDGPWILVDALDDDLDGLFGEDPETSADRDKDGSFGEDDVDPSDTNEPYMVHWTIPDWLVIDDPKTETVIEETAEYWIIAVAGDASTGPLDQGMPANSIPYPKDNWIHWDSPYHVIDSYDCLPRAALVTVVDDYPPQTRVLQVASYAVPSETKIVVGKTVTVYAGDTEVDWIPPNTFPTPEWDGQSFEDYKYDPAMENAGAPAWPAHGAPWAIGMLYPVRYDPDVEPEKYLYDEWKPNRRVVLRYAGPYAGDAAVPVFPDSGQTYADTEWQTAETDAIHMGVLDPGRTKWQVTNWVTGGSVTPDGKYFITVTAEDDVGHVTGQTYGAAERVIPDVVEIWIDNNVEPVTLTASELKSDGTLEIVTNNQMERGQPLVLYVDPKMNVADLDKVTFMFKAKHDYDWTLITIDAGDPAIAMTQPYSVTLSPLGRWSGVTNEPHNIALGNIYQFKAVGEDAIGNKVNSNIIELTVVDRVAEAAIGQVRRLDGFNEDEKFLRPNQITVPRLTGRIGLFGCTDADVVGVTFLYREQGAQDWTEIEGILNRGFDVDGDGDFDDVDPWETAGWLTDGIDNDGDWDPDTDDLNNNGEADPGEPNVDEPGECGYHYVGQQNWYAIWNTTTLMNGVYELAVVANTGDNKSDVSDVLVVVVDHNAVDIVDAITDWIPKSGQAVGGWTRRQVISQNPILDPDDKLDNKMRGEVDVCVTFGNGVPPDLDMGIPTGVGHGRMPQGTALDPSLSFEYKMAARPDIGDETIHDKTVVEPNYYWKKIESDVVYDAASLKFCAVWRTVEHDVLNGYYDVRVRVVDEAGNIAYKVIAEKVVVDNTAPDAMITSIDDDNTLTYVDGDGGGTSVDSSVSSGAMATDTEIAQNSLVTVRATAIDALSEVAYIQFQVRAATIQSGKPLAGMADEFNLIALSETEWTDIGLVTRDANPEHSYSLKWDTTGLWEGDYLLRVEAVDIVGNKKFSGAVKVTVVDTVPPIATIVGYHPDQLQFLHYFWPKKYWLDNIYAATICQADVQEVQIQYRVVGSNEWIPIGVPTIIPFEQLDTPEDKRDEVFDVLRKTFYPPAVAQDEAVLLAYDWTGLWGTTWVPNLPEGTEIQLRAIAKDWSGNVTPPELAPVLNARVLGGMVDPVTPGSGMAIEFTANLGGTGVGDPTDSQANGLLETYENLPTVVLTVDAPNAIENPTVLVLVELDTPQGLVYGGEIVEVFQEEGAPGRYSAALKGDELMVWIAGYPEPLNNYLELLRLGGKITAFATVTTGRGTEIATTSLTMNDLRVFPVTAELGTNGTVTSKDGVVKVMVPRAALRESYVDVRPGGDASDPEDLRIYLQKAGLFITPVKDMPNTPRDQRLSLEPVGQAYNIQMLNGDGLEYISFRPGFEPKITLDYSRFDIPADGEALGFVSVRYWDPYRWEDDGRWANDDIINLSVDEVAKTITFNLKSFGYVTDDDLRIPHTIFSIVLEKSLGRINEVVFDDAYVYPDEPDMSYMKELDRDVFFRVVDPAGIDWGSIRVYVDGELAAVGVDGQRIKHVDGKEEGNQVFCFDPDKEFLNLTEGIHTLKLEAWDKVDAVDESNWQMLEKTVAFFIDRTPPLVVTHGAQRDNVRWFSTPEGATAAVTIVDEGVGLSAADLQRSINVDVFEHLVTGVNTPLRTIDQGNAVNFQRKVLRATSRPILEYADDYTPDGVDNETWVGIHDGASNVRHLAWRASYTIQMGQIDDGDTYEVVFYTEKCPSALSDDYNENAIYLYEDLTKMYMLTDTGVRSYNWSPEEFFKPEIMPTAEADSFTGYYKKTFLVDIIGNTKATNIPHTGSSVTGESTVDRRDGGFYYEMADQFFVRDLVADTRRPLVELDIPSGVKADDAAATVSATATDDASGIATATFVINGEVVDEVIGPVNNASLEYTFGAGEAASSNEIKAVVVDVAGNKEVQRGSFGVQEMDAPVISDMTPEGEGVADATPTIGAAYSDATGIDLSTVTLTLNGAVMTDITVGESKVSYTPVKPLEAGVTYTVKVSAKDKAGLPVESIWTFALETDEPVITDTTPTGVDETGTPHISAKYSDAGTGINKDSVKLMVDNKAVEAQVTESSVSYKPADVMNKGKHMATLTVADMAGTIVELTWEFNIEETPPAITNVEPSGTINDDMPIISARYSDAGTGIDVGSVALSLNGEVAIAEVTGSQVSYAVKEPLKTGVSHIVTVTVADKAGNVGTGTSTFRLEGTAPSISNMSPTGTVQSVDVAVSATYSDAGSGVNPSTAVMKLDGVVVPTTPTASGISYQAAGLLNGDHTVHVEVADQFGNVGTRTWTFTVERTPPTISSVGPSGEISTATPVLTAAYDDAGTGVDVNNVVLSLNGHVVPATITATKASYAILTPLERGVTYNVTVQVADKAGNIASDSATFSLETTPPDVTATKPTGTVSEDDAVSGVEIAAKLSDDGSGVNPDSVMMWLDGDPIDGDASVSNVSYTVKGLAYGEHTVRLVVADMLGNVADETWTFDVDDSTPPTVTVVSPKQDDVVGVQPMIKISYADAGSGVDLTSISVKVDDNPVMASAMAPADPAGAKVVSAGEASYEVRLGYGPHTLTVTVKDVAGNEATAEVNFVVEGDVLKVVKPHNYPNPFRGGNTTITFGLSQQSEITIRIYDFTATLVATVAEEEVTQSGDEVEFIWDGTTDAGDGNSLANGVYFCKVLAKTDSETKYEIIKIALVRE